MLGIPEECSRSIMVAHIPFTSRSSLRGSLTSVIIAVCVLILPCEVCLQNAMDFGDISDDYWPNPVGSGLLHLTEISLVCIQYYISQFLQATQYLPADRQSLVDQGTAPCVYKAMVRTCCKGNTEHEAMGCATLVCQLFSRCSNPFLDKREMLR